MPTSFIAMTDMFGLSFVILYYSLKQSFGIGASAPILPPSLNPSVNIISHDS